jgi:hypothetical protein
MVNTNFVFSPKDKNKLAQKSSKKVEKSDRFLELRPTSTLNQTPLI